MNSSEYINEQRREFSLYVLQMRAIPYAADGLKAAARRVLWTARDGKKYKSATLAGATMPIHPHAAPEGTINTLAAPYTNNIPLLEGDGAFGTLLNPTAYGASRYTSVKISQFTKDVIFKDIEIIPKVENYDGTQLEPKHFLPLVPVALVNSQEGIAVGFASNILPRELDVIIKDQIKYLEGKEIKFEGDPAFENLHQYAQDWEELSNGNTKWFFKGSFTKINATTIRIDNLPYGITHEKYTEKLAKLEDIGTITDVEDNSKDHYNIQLTFKKGVLSKLDDDEIIELIGLENTINENMNVIDFEGQRVWSTDYTELVTTFTEWRLGWYKVRYQRLADLLLIDIQKYKDILTAIRRNVSGVAKKIQSKNELKEFLTEIGIVHIDYIADLPIYRFTEEEKQKVRQKLTSAEQQLKEYNALLKSKDKRSKVYIEELKEILHANKKGIYAPTFD